MKYDSPDDRSRMVSVTPSRKSLDRMWSKHTVNSSLVGRSDGSLAQHRRIIFRMGRGVYTDKDEKLGLSPSTMASITSLKNTLLKLGYGSALRENISHSRTPKAYTSDEGWTSRSKSNRSGAIQKSDPLAVPSPRLFRRVLATFILFAIPKSPTLISGNILCASIEVRKQFAAFKSLCTIAFRCKYSTASAISCAHRIRRSIAIVG
mmetsp:Transcript_15295/g.43375  ORF Transcript_15295/g.43375 Transcript_15295/m.43375 type:complete len:206 (-) Transcript_15295:804-1421(-)